MPVELQALRRQFSPTSTDPKAMSVYAIHDSVGMVNYIGITKNPIEQRLIRHRANPTSKRMRQWIRSTDGIGITKLGVAPSSTAKEVEREIISWCKDNGGLLNTHHCVKLKTFADYQVFVPAKL